MDTSNKVIKFEGQGMYTTKDGREVEASVTFKSNGEVKTENGEVWLKVIVDCDNDSLDLVEFKFNE